jgi:hypothetical protein
MKKTILTIGILALLSVSLATGALLQERYKIIPFLDVEDLSVRDDAIIGDQLRVNGNIHLENNLPDGYLCLEGGLITTNCGAE